MSTLIPGPTPSTLQALIRRPVFREMTKFMSVGCVNLALSLIIYNVSLGRLRTAVPDAHLRMVASNTIAFLITVSTAFLLNARFTFKQRHADMAAYVRYGVVNLVGFGLNTLLVVGYSHVVAILRHETVQALLVRDTIGKNVAYLAAVGCVFFWNFFMSRHWVFRHRVDVGSVPPTGNGAHRPAANGKLAPMESE